MPRRIRIGLVFAVAVVLGFPTAAWVTGIVVEKQNEADEQRRLGETPYVVRTKRDYRRGVFSSVEHATYQLSLPTAKGGPVTSPSGSWHLTTHCVIHHGPLPQLRTLALATADCDLELPPELGQSIKAALGGKPPVELRIRTGWLGSSTTAFTSPAFTLKLENGATVNWRGFDGTMAASRGLATWSGSLTAPGLTVDHASTHAEIGTLILTADMRRAYDTLDVGSVSLKAAGAVVRSADDDTNLVLKGVTVSGVSSQNGDYVDSAVELAVDTLEAKQFSATRVGYAFRLNHAHGPSLAALSKAMREVQREALTGSHEAFQAKLRDSFREHGIDVLSHDPVLEIPRIGFAMPEGEARLSARLSAPGLTREELQGPTLPATILRHLQAEADLGIDAALLDKLLSRNQNADAVRQRLAALERQGYVKQAGGRYAVHLSYERGRTVVNGLPFPSAGAQAKP